MAPKKTSVVASAATPAASPPPKRAPRKKEATPADATTDAASNKKRNMTAVPNGFVTAVMHSLPEDLATKLKNKELKEICEAFVKTLVDNVKKGETVSFTNNMTFKRQQRCARTYKNLKTGEAINKPPHYVLCMQVKPALKKAFDELEVAPVP